MAGRAGNWLARNLDAIARGADAVAGQAEIEPEGAKLIPAHLHAIDARECAYAALLDEIRALLDPDPADPWPRHDEHSGASIAVTVEAYRRAGGMPDVSLAEDRAFIDRLRLVDARIRHERGVSVVVSARTVGRADGGMADTMRRRIAQPDEFLDERLEPVGQRPASRPLPRVLAHDLERAPALRRRYRPHRRTAEPAAGGRRGIPGDAIFRRMLGSGGGLQPRPATHARGAEGLDPGNGACPRQFATGSGAEQKSRRYAV